MKQMKTAYLFWDQVSRSLQKTTIFTLIELMIVISIIAILASILLPALNSAKEFSKSTFCMNNIRQVGLGFTYYAEDFDGYIPGPATYRVGAGYNWSFIDNIAEYVKEGAKQSFKVPAFKCPDDNGFEKRKNIYSTSYGVNEVSTFGAYYYAPTDWCFTPPIRLSNCSSPSRMYMLIEDYGHCLPDLTHTTVPANEATLGQAPAFRHRGKCSVVFYDLNAQSLKPKKVPCSFGYPGASRKMIMNTIFVRGSIAAGHENESITGL